MSDLNFDPMVQPNPRRHHVPRMERSYPSPRRPGEWVILAVAAALIVLGVTLYVHNYDTASLPVAAPSTTGSASRLEPRPVPQLPVLPEPPAGTPI